MQTILRHWYVGCWPGWYRGRMWRAIKCNSVEHLGVPLYFGSPARCGLVAYMLRPCVSTGCVAWRGVRVGWKCGAHGAAKGLTNEQTDGLTKDARRPASLLGGDGRNRGWKVQVKRSRSRLPVVKFAGAWPTWKEADGWPLMILSDVRFGGAVRGCLTI